MNPRCAVPPVLEQLSGIDSRRVIRTNRTPNGPSIRLFAFVQFGLAAKAARPFEYRRVGNQCTSPARLRDFRPSVPKKGYHRLLCHQRVWKLEIQRRTTQSPSNGQPVRTCLSICIGLRGVLYLPLLCYEQNVSTGPGVSVCLCAIKSVFFLSSSNCVCVSGLTFENLFQ